MDQVPSPVSSPSAYDQLHAPKLLASLYQSPGFLHPALGHHHFTLPPHLQNLQDPFRPRSGSLLSLGSTGSSHRPERSPSRESTSSHDSLTRASPIGYMPDSPSPSPPNESSKLLGLLKGTSQSPFSGLFTKPHHISSKPEMPVRRASTALDYWDVKQRSDFSLKRPSLSHHDVRHINSSSRHPYPLDMYSKEFSKKPPPPPPQQHMRELFNRSSSLRDSLPPPRDWHRSNSISEAPLKRHVEDTPMDLSCKRPRCATMGGFSNIRRGPPPAETVTRSSLQISNEPYTPSNKLMLEPISPPSRAPSRDSVASQGSNDDSSILRSILCGGGLNSSGQSETSCPSRPASIKSDGSCSGMAVCTSPTDLSEPASPSNSILSRLMAGSPCNVESNQRVGIAKKTLFPVRARVTFWLVQTMKYAKSLPEFSSLCEEDKLIIINNTWAKMLVIFMAENNFEFAVSPVVETDGGSIGETGNPEVPTMKAVENMQGFIHKLHALNLDVTEFTQLKTIVLFQIGIYGMKEKAIVEEANSRGRQGLQQHVQETKPEDKLRYSNILLRLHALPSINNQMIRNLFCKHITSTVSIEDYLKDLLLEKDAANSKNKAT